MMVYSYNDQFSGHFRNWTLSTASLKEPTLLDPIIDMMPEIWNSSLLSNSSKQVPSEMYMHATIEPIYKQWIGKHRTGVLVETVFPVRSMQSGYIERVS
jgi:hypothetical protein